MEQAERKAALGQLVALQDEEGALAAIEARLKQIPVRSAVIEKSLAGAEAQVAQAKQGIQDAAKERRGFEQEIESVKTVISRYQGQLLEVKTNEQYRALSHEIATEKRKIDGIEEKILHNMERADELGRTVKDKEALLGGERARVAAEKEVLDRERRTLEQEKAEREASRRTLESSVPAELLSLFRRIGKTRSGIAISRSRDGACGECRVRARPQALAEARAFDRIVQCESCSRILYVTEPPPAVARMEPEAADEGES